MKVKIETAVAAKLFGCEIGEFRDLQRPDAMKLIENNDISEADASADVMSLDDMTVDQLKAYALEHQIDLGDATKKADIRAAIDLAAV